MAKLCLVISALAVLASALTLPYPQAARTEMHVRHRRDTPPSGYVKAGAAPNNHLLELHLSLAQSNFAELEQRLLAASTPGNAAYGQYLSKEEVAGLVAPSNDTLSALDAWLASHNLTSTALSPAGDLHVLRLTVKQANTLLDADYATYTDQTTGTQTVRTLSYSLPAGLKHHVHSVWPTTQFAPALASLVKPFSVSTTGLRARANVSCDDTFTVSCAIDLYGIPTDIPAQTASQLGVAGFTGQSANYADLKSFLDTYRPDVPDSTNFTVQLVGGANNNQSDPGVEANLDIETTVGITAPTVPITFIDVGTADGTFFDQLPLLASALLSATSPPDVVTMSYSLPESFIDAATATSICNAYAQVAARGIAVLVASGDYGVSGGEDPDMCKAFQPGFPSSCPYVTSVGGTINVSPEIGWNNSGSGFSNYFPAPAWQTAATDAYKATLPAAVYAGRYNASGRGFPDLSANANFVEVSGGEVASGTGTSMSAPVVAGVFALLNAELRAAGKPALGFLNPWIYANAGAFTDVLVGGGADCGGLGFSATLGWDALTGVGTPVYSKLRAAAGL